MNKSLYLILLAVFLVAACTPKIMPTPAPRPASESKSPPGNPEFSAYLPIFRPVPLYPRVAAEQRLEGWVDLTFDVDTSGRTKNIRVMDASPKSLFDKAALYSVSGYLYEPVIRDGKPIEANGVSIRVVFEME